MTICIAAACEDNGKPLIVLCADTKTSFYDGLTNTGGYTKMQIPAPGWCALMSGPTDYAKRLAWECGDYLKDNPISLRSVQKHFKTPLKKFRHWLMDETAAKYGVSYDDFLAGSIKEKSILRDMRLAFNAIPKDTSVILTSIIDSYPLIVRIESDLISTDNAFAAIGSGGFLATVMLCQRNIGPAFVPLEDAAYLAYEAKRFSEKDAHVNETTTMCIQREYREEDGDSMNYLEWIKPDAIARLKQLHSMYGLQEIKGIPPRDILFGSKKANEVLD